MENPSVDYVKNPSIDYVMATIVETIKRGSALPIDEDALDTFDATYRPRFYAALQMGSWERDRKKLLSAANQHGIIATAIAILHDRHATHVDDTALGSASLIVERECSIGVLGAWCGERRDGQP